ncbi:hypothetical protein AHiyo8_17360 [Arthrobacter sp. Hiyo8]|nr:hypothetical protein AHiyo8_17360 [Arthrobacter sp. Hiyo8]
MGQALRIQEDAVVAEYASVKYRSREVPGIGMLTRQIRRRRTAT